MPSLDLLPRFAEDLRVRAVWQVNGMHYARTAEAWLANLDRTKFEDLRILQRPGAGDSARLAVRRWRMFFMAVAELFAYRHGEEWFVAHYLFEKPTA